MEYMQDSKEQALSKEIASEYGEDVRKVWERFRTAKPQPDAQACLEAALEEVHSKDVEQLRKAASEPFRSDLLFLPTNDDPVPTDE